ncbi:MAG: 50S ribosomal protein L25 [Chloroflexota bacterium]
MAEFQLSVQKRTTVGKKVNKLRREGIVPIVIYGPKTDPANYQVDYRTLEMTLRDAGGTNLIEIQSEDETYQVLARDVQRDVVRRDILHVDFFAIDPNSRITVDVPVVYINQSPAVAARKGILLTGPNSLSIEMLATNMLDEVVINLEDVPELNDAIYVRDLNLAEGAKILNDPEEMIVRVSQSSAARREEALAAVEAMGGEVAEGEAPEIIGEGEEEE